MTVAPFTGARIETLRHLKKAPSVQVAPFTGARIETGKRRFALDDSESPPSRGRGLKP